MKKSTRRGSLFGKLIGSYVIFSMAAILLLIVAVLISFVFSYGNVLQENFPGITVGADGTIQNLDGIRNMNGWVEKLDAQYHVETVYGRKQTTQMAYTKEQLLDAFSLKDDVPIVNSESLSMLQDFLCTHRYKEFRDQANALRTPFILQTIISTPTSVKYYNGGRLIKSAENDSTGNTSTTYSYDDKGQLISTLSLTVKNGQPSNEIQTNRLYDPQGHCIFEVQTNPKTKTDLYRRTRRIGTDGSIESDSLKYTDGRVIISSYNKQGLLTETKEYNKNGELQAYTANKYDDKGRLISSQHQNLLFANSSDQIISQKDAYEYDKYGYLTQIVYQRILGNNQKTSGCLTCLYDKYGNQIDSNSYYEYDNTGQWICRTDREHPKEVERIQYIYK